MQAFQSLEVDISNFNNENILIKSRKEYQADSASNFNIIVIIEEINAINEKFNNFIKKYGHSINQAKILELLIKLAAIKKYLRLKRYL